MEEGRKRFERSIRGEAAALAPDLRPTTYKLARTPVEIISPTSSVPVETRLGLGGNTFDTNKCGSLLQVMANVDEKVYEYLLSRYNTTDTAEEKRRCLTALASSKSTALASRTLEMVLSDKVSSAPLIPHYVACSALTA